MRNKFTTLVFVALGYAATAQQFSILPQIGIENSTTSLIYNNLPSFSPLGNQASPQIGVRMDYKFKQGHGPFVRLVTNRSIVNYSFSNPESGMNTYNASAGNTRLRLDGGYQYSTKPIYFNKSRALGKSANVSTGKKEIKTRCGSYMIKSSCGKKSSETQLARTKNKGWHVSIQPSLGAAYLPAMDADVSTEANQTSYTYNAGNWNVALISGAGFEFGKNLQRKFTVSLNYLKGLGNLDTRTITTVSGTKTVTTQLKSRTSSWSLSAGIPITLNKKKTEVKKIEVQKPSLYEKKCGQYKKSGCSRMKFIDYNVRSL